MTKVYKSGGEKSQSQSDSVSTPAQQEQYNNLLSGADAWLKGGGFDKNYGGSPDFNGVAGFTPEQQAALNSTNNTGQWLQNRYSSAGIKSLDKYFGEYDPSKTGLNSAIDASNNRLDWNYNTGVAPQVRQGATDAGQYGSTRHGVAEGIALSNLSQQKTDAASTMAYQDQQAYNQNQLNVLNNLSGITQGLNSGNALQFNAGLTQQQQNQAGINGDLQKWAYENNVSLNDLMAYQQLVSGNMGGTNVGQSTARPGSTGGGGAGVAAGALGGAAAGATVGGPWGAAAGGIIGGVSAM
jgi:hypothetical protein